MDSIQPEEISIRLNIMGADRYEKVSFPIRYGRYCEVETPNFIFQFNLNGEIKYISGKNTSRIEPTEWLKRTEANDWVFYSSGGYNGAVRTIGEHYVPCFTYQSNAVTGGNPFKNGFLGAALSAFSSLQSIFSDFNPEPDNPEMIGFIRNVSRKNEAFLLQKAETFHQITDGPVTVLPPDARHVDYDVIPVNIARGCLYNCRFCTVKTGGRYEKKDKNEIENQINALGAHYSLDIENFNSVFLGQHDALNAGADLIEFASCKAFELFRFKYSNIKTPRLFMFGSADSLLRFSEKDFRRLNNLPFETYINIGIESFDQQTLSILGKPVSAEKMKKGFHKMVEINKAFTDVEITANILIGKDLPESHYSAFAEAVRGIDSANFSKGTLYMSPFENETEKSWLLKRFKMMKNQSRFPVFLYLIQRL